MSKAVHAFVGWSRIALVLLLSACSPGWSGGPGGPGGPGGTAETGGPVPAPAAALAASPAPAAMFYVTDRRPKQATAAWTTYGTERSTSMAFGELIPAGQRRGAQTFAARERIRFPSTPLPFSQSGGRIVPDPLEANDYDIQSRRLQQDLAAALRAAGVRDVVLFVHGFNNSFDQAVTTAAILRDAVAGQALPVVFSWPAGGGGLTGYFHDRENGEFSVLHLKETLRLLAGVPGLRNIQIVAHSRGAAVTTTALREMVIAARARGRLPREVLKVDNLILAAPDIDFGIVGQRLIAEQFGPAFGRISVYMNPADGALGLSQSLVSGTRFGRATLADLDDNERTIFTRIRNVDFITVERVATGSGHGYFHRNPVVLNDIALVLRRSVPPSDPRRGLVPLDVNFWSIVNPADRRTATAGADQR